MAKRRNIELDALRRLADDYIIKLLSDADARNTVHDLKEAETPSLAIIKRVVGRYRWDQFRREAPRLAKEETEVLTKRIREYLEADWPGAIRHLEIFHNFLSGCVKCYLE